ncbi:zinc finger protein 845-like [Chrysoperla carnea]|uniref:zinc finger protein 845-like n=1 Tax=Chrysoperla carnea TaxID=189513 RepID=UPI001D079C01|nr:zinc finger protein 845-like [Chrysoperla carnea]
MDQWNSRLTINGIRKKIQTKLAINNSYENNINTDLTNEKQTEKELNTENSIKNEIFNENDTKEFEQIYLKEQDVTTVHERLKEETLERQLNTEFIIKDEIFEENVLNQQATPNKNKRFLCGKCDKAFTTKNQLRRHRRTHTGKKPYSCEECDKTFTQQSDLNRHNRTHSEEKPFSCEICSRAFTQETSLTKHKRTHEEEKRFSCEICNKTFTENSSLISHKRIHSGEKHFSCENECDNCELLRKRIAELEEELQNKNKIIADFVLKNSESTNKVYVGQNKVGFVDAATGKIYLAENILIEKGVFVSWLNVVKPTIFVKKVAKYLFGKEVLRRSTITGKISNRSIKNNDERPMQLDPIKIAVVRDVYEYYLKKRFNKTDYEITKELAQIPRYIRMLIADLKKPNQPKNRQKIAKLEAIENYDEKL